MSSISNFSGQDRNTEFPLKKSVQASVNINQIIYSILRDVNNLLNDSVENIEKMRQSEKKDLPDVLTVTEKVGLGLELAIATKNKIVESYCH